MGALFEANNNIIVYYFVHFTPVVLAEEIGGHFSFILSVYTAQQEQ